MPTDAQARAILRLLVPWAGDADRIAPARLVAMWHALARRGWVVSAWGVSVTAEGRDALACYLLRAWRP